jgi:hypothetical protein
MMAKTEKTMTRYSFKDESLKCQKSKKNDHSKKKVIEKQVRALVNIKQNTKDIQERH